MAVRRRVDWPIILGPKVPVPTVVNSSVRGKLAELLSAFDEILALDDPDAILRRAVELAHERIGLQRAGIFLLDRAHGRMLGTWGIGPARRARRRAQHHVRRQRHRPRSVPPRRGRG